MLSFLSITFIDSLTVVSVIFLCLFCVYLYYNNKKLNKIIEEFKIRDKNRYEENVLKEDIVDIKEISCDVDNNKVEEIVDKIEVNKNGNSCDNTEKNDDDIIKKDISYVDNNKFDIEDFIKKDKYIIRKLGSSDMNSEYLQEVSRELESSMAPQTIKLTDYEQEQEDNAIISYKELLDVNKKDNIVNDGTVEFIEELKKFRNNLR